MYAFERSRIESVGRCELLVGHEIVVGVARELPSGHIVFERAGALDGDFDRVSVRERAYPRRRPGRDNVALLEGDQVRDPGDELTEREN